MKRLPISISILLLFMAFFFNLERLDLSQQNLVNLQSSVYVFTTFVIITMIAIPSLRRAKIWFLLVSWNVIYLILRIFIFNSHPLLGDMHTYLTTVEIALLSIAILLTNNLNHDIEDFIEAVENITFDDLRDLSNTKDAEEDIQTEIYRSRRFQHPLTVVLVEPLQESLRMILNRSLQEVQRSMMSRYVSVSLARALRGQLRRTDLMYEQREKKRFVILTPETNIQNAPDIVRRVHEAAYRLGASINFGVASFPEDALTFEELLHSAEERMKSSTSELNIELPEPSVIGTETDTTK